MWRISPSGAGTGKRIIRMLALGSIVIPSYEFGSLNGTGQTVGVEGNGQEKCGTNQDTMSQFMFSHHFVIWRDRIEWLDYGVIEGLPNYPANSNICSVSSSCDSIRVRRALVLVNCLRSLDCSENRLKHCRTLTKMSSAELQSTLCKRIKELHMKRCLSDSKIQMVVARPAPRHQNPRRRMKKRATRRNRNQLKEPCFKGKGWRESFGRHPLLLLMFKGFKPLCSIWFSAR